MAPGSRARDPELRRWPGGRPKTDERLDVPDPATGEVLGRVPLSGPSEVDHAVRVAAEAFQSWQDEPVTRRARRMFGLQVLLERQLDQLAELVTRENGKHLDEARGEVRRGIEVVELAAGMTTLMKGETLDQVARGVDVSLHRFPLGVCCGITPFNFPAMIPLWFAPLAIAAGNTFVLKPSQRTPLTANRLAELFAEAGFPDGVFNVVHGAQEAVEALIDHPQIAGGVVRGLGPGCPQGLRALGIARQAGPGARRRQEPSGGDARRRARPRGAGRLRLRLLQCRPALPGGLGGGRRRRDRRRAGRRDLARWPARRGSRRATTGHDADSTITPVTTPEALERIAGYIELGEQEGATLCVDGRGRARTAASSSGRRCSTRCARDDASPGRRSSAPCWRWSGSSPWTRRSRRSTPRSSATRPRSSPGRRRRPHVRARGEGGMIGVNVSVPAPVAFFPFAGWRARSTATSTPPDATG